MYRIECDYCGETLSFPALESKPETCPNCNSFLDHLEPEETPDEQANSNEARDNRQVPEQQLIPDGMTLTYQTTGEQIKIPHSDRIILGRKHTGQEVLGKAPQISRTHCQIELRDGQYAVSDLGSMHGTFIGVDKIDCRENPRQVINDGELLYLGREPFMAKLLFKEPAEDISSETALHSSPTEEKEEKPVKYRCTDCGMEFDKKEEICPNCGCYDSMEEV